MIRITSGIAKGKRLQLPNNNKKVTAVKEVVKLAIFSIIGNKIENATCLDLFAGSGNLGIEALSRGASFCDFVDESKYSIETIEKNLKNCGLADRANPIWDEVLKYLANAESMYDIIFADPYYTETNHRHLIKLAVERLNPHGLFFLLTSSSQPTGSPLPPRRDRDDIENVIARREIVIGWDESPPKADEAISTRVETRKYGKTLLSIVRN